MTGVAVGALVATTALVVPSLGAAQGRPHVAAKRTMPATNGALGTFTPVAADPRLAAMFARGGLDAGSFRFTPTDSRADRRAVTVAVRARTNRPVDNSRVAFNTEQAPGVAPIAYSLGVAVGWKRFAVSGDVSRVDMAQRPGSREAADVAVSYSVSRFTGRMKAAADRPIEDAPTLVEAGPSYSLDLGGSYKLTRNLDVTAGVRYRTERERLARFDSDRRDSQAVYVGTAFRF